MSGAGFWEAVLGEIEKRLRRQQFETWFRSVGVLEATPERLRLAVPNRFFKEWLETYYVPVIKESATAVGGKSPRIDFEIESRPVAEVAPASSPAPSAEGAAVASAPPGDKTAGSLQPSFSPRYTFENFVVGPANRLCHAAALAVVEAPGRAYNPLFVHGGVGLGKTHLLHAASQAFLERNPQARLVYISCEEFVNDFVSAVQHGDLASFRRRLRDVDFLVIDDIHFLARAERTQEEFFHTFNTLYNAHKQIILSSDSPPAEIPTLEERLVSRFKWGLVARLDSPTYETRLAIVLNKASLRGYNVPGDVAEFVAHSVDTNIRELEGALTRVVGFAALSNRSLTLPLAQEALQEMLMARPSVSIEDIAKAVSVRFGVKLSDLQGRRRTKSVALPRQICMHIARKLTEYSLEEIGGFFGGRDHTTVLYADDKISRLLETDLGIRTTVGDIQSELSRAS
ncbi:MAG: chromosomal replication initiator protein DnaA [Planctomycetes bacterium]|nr:chromosomal replication initiator protein DnaA [Planctomycetota bacterium]